MLKGFKSFSNVNYQSKNTLESPSLISILHSKTCVNCLTLVTSGKTFPDAEKREPLIVHSLIREEVIERGTRSNAFEKQPRNLGEIRYFMKIKD